MLRLEVADENNRPRDSFLGPFGGSPADALGPVGNA